jgi:hypothetical protein
MLTCTACPDDPQTNVLRDIRALKTRISELRDALGNCSPRLVCSTWWLEKLDEAATARRRLERLQLLLEG